ncbi:MAG: hypothetical protein K0R93_3723 [Anaerosolibacter sp.]|uniref:hypothetical protein n=1 Tax=Anaerosolibacter sp. TaxID=1872527 RepID=UPI0026326311|nr:hypothetical protein [Anaerosolibacter sp.]MDF2548825.1 hypothetical protein [Anaerosolibacter sp.]
MRKNKLLIVSILVVMLIPSLAHSATADESITKIGDTLIQQSLSDYEYLYATSSSLINKGSGSVTVSAYTEAMVSVDSVYVRAYLQKYDTANSTWVNLYCVYDTRTDTDYASASKGFLADIA